tara:strand:- start:1686 stop:2738 length:1053 start_codon:yes stop_codon:yes gene_type:complete
MEEHSVDEIESTAKEFWWASFRHLKNAERISKAAGIGVIVFGLIATAGGIIASSPSNLQTLSASTIGIWGAGIAVVCALIQKFLEKDHTSLLEQAKVSLDRSQAFLYQRKEIKRQIEDMQSLDTQRLQMQSTFGYMLEHTEQILAASGRTEIKEAIESLFDLCQAELLASMGMTYADKMTISVYKVIEGDAPEDPTLEILVNKKPNRAEEQDYVSRSWRKGEGYSGQAWMLANEVVVPDTISLPSSLHTTNLGAQAKGDPEAELRRYRSVASVPVFLGTSDKVWGVVSVTTNQPNKFSTHSVDDDVAAQNVETVRILSKMIAVLVACCANVNEQIGTSAVNESGGTDEIV